MYFYWSIKYNNNKIDKDRTILYACKLKMYKSIVHSDDYRIITIKEFEELYATSSEFRRGFHNLHIDYFNKIDKQLFTEVKSNRLLSNMKIVFNILQRTMFPSNPYI